jgi:transposase InsO family protein
MNEELRFPIERVEHQIVAGKDELERSGSESFPATSPAAEVSPTSTSLPGPESDSVGRPTDDASRTVAPAVATESRLPEPTERAAPALASAGSELGVPFAEDPWEPTREASHEQSSDDPVATDPLSDLGWAEDAPPALRGRARGTLSKPKRPQLPLSPTQKLLILDTWQRSGLPARDFAALVNVSHHTLYAWKRRFDELGPVGLVEQPRGAKSGSKLPELTKRTILMLKQGHPEWGCQRISDMLVRGPALPASPGAVARVLHEAGYQLEEVATQPNPATVRTFERAKPNQLWQTDLFTFMLKRQYRRVYLVAFLDDHSRFITGYGLYGSQSTLLVVEVLRAALAAYGVPGEILTDNGTQYVTWRGKSQFTRELEKLGIRQIVAKPKRPQTLGKIERFWGTLWRECLQASIFLDLEDARRRIGLFIDYYNFQRVHSGIDGLVPADRFFHAAPEVLKTLKERVAANALQLAKQGIPKQPFYLTGQLDGKPFSVHREGDRVVLRQAGQQREEIDLVPPAQREDSVKPVAADLPQPLCPDGSPQGGGPLPDADRPPGTSPLDDWQRSTVVDPSEQIAPGSDDSGTGGAP